MPAHEPSGVRPALLVNRPHLLEGLQRVLKIKALGNRPALFRFVDGQLVVVFGDYTFRADAEGNWQGQAKLKGTLLRGLAKSPPPGGATLYVFFEDDTLHFYRSPDETSGRSLEATWETE